MPGKKIIEVGNSLKKEVGYCGRCGNPQANLTAIQLPGGKIVEVPCCPSCVCDSPFVQDRILMQEGLLEGLYSFIPKFE